MNTRTRAANRLTLRGHPAPQARQIVFAVAGAGLVLAAALLRQSPLALALGVAGIGLLLPLLWATRPGPVTVIDRRAGQVEQRSALGRLRQATRFERIEGVTCDQVCVPLPGAGGGKGDRTITIYRTRLLTGDAPVTVRGFGAPGPAREMKAAIERWLAEAPAPEVVK